MKHLMTAITCFGLLLSAHGQTWNPDENVNNLIDINDLMALLSVYGNEWTIDGGEASGYNIAAYYAGEMELLECIRTCKSNNAAVMSVDEYALFQDSVDVAIGLTLSDDVCTDPDDSYYYSYFYRSAHCRNDSDFGYGYIRRGGTYECSGTELLEFYSGTNFYGQTSSSTFHCVCSGLVPSLE